MTDQSKLTDARRAQAVRLVADWRDAIRADSTFIEFEVGRDLCALLSDLFSITEPEINEHRTGGR